MKILWWSRNLEALVKMLFFWFVCRVSREENLASQTLKAKDEREDMNKNMNAPRNFERSYSSSLSSERSNIKFNTGVSIITKNIVLVYIWIFGYLEGLKR